MSQSSDGKQEDDGLNLVQQVLAENPPEERGERDEWERQVGWHRKEDIHQKASLRGASKANSNDPIGDTQNNEALNPAKSGTEFWKRRETMIRSGCAVISLACLVVFFRRMLHLSNASRKRGKNR